MVYVPFLGGGALTVLFPLIISRFGPWLSVAFAFVMMLIFFLASVFSGWTSFFSKGRNVN